MSAESARVAPRPCEGEVRVGHDFSWQIGAQASVHAAVHSLLGRDLPACARYTLIDLSYREPAPPKLPCLGYAFLAPQNSNSAHASGIN